MIYYFKGVRVLFWSDWDVCTFFIWILFYGVLVHTNEYLYISKLNHGEPFVFIQALVQHDLL
jgi:hypothetical protein